MVKRAPIATIVPAAMLAFLAGPGAVAASADFVCPVLPGSAQGQDQRYETGRFITIGSGDQSDPAGSSGRGIHQPR